MCLGAQARAQNQAARRQYNYELQRRERNWFQQLSVTNAQHVKYEEDVANAGLAQAQAYADKQEAMALARGEAQIKYDQLFRDLEKNSDYSKLAASGVTGRSARRIGTMEYAELGRKTSEIARAVTLNDRELARKTSQQVSQYQAFKKDAFAKVAFQPIPDVAPPKPVMVNVGAAAFMDALSIGSSIATMGGSSGFGLWVPK